MKNLLIMGTLALSLSCSSFSWGQNNVPEPVPQVGARILLDTQKSFSRSDDVVLEITLENTGKTPLRFRYRNIEFFYNIEVITAGGKKESLLGYELPQFSGYFFTIPPQGKRKGYVYLNRVFDLSKEGLYTVTVSNKSRQLQVEGVFTVTSQPFDFKIAGPPKFGDWEADTVPTVSQTKIR